LGELKSQNLRRSHLKSPIPPRLKKLVSHRKKSGSRKNCQRHSPLIQRRCGKAKLSCALEAKSEKSAASLTQRSRGAGHHHTNSQNEKREREQIPSSVVVLQQNKLTAATVLVPPHRRTLHFLAGERAKESITARPEINIPHQPQPSFSMGSSYTTAALLIRTPCTPSNSK